MMNEKQIIMHCEDALQMLENLGCEKEAKDEQTEKAIDFYKSVIKYFSVLNILKDYTETGVGVWEDTYFINDYDVDEETYRKIRWWKANEC